MFQQNFPFEASLGYRFVVQDIQIKMKLLSCSMHYEPIRIATESVLFGSETIEGLAKKVVAWTKHDEGVIAFDEIERLQVITNSVVITGRILDGSGSTVKGQKITELFLRPFMDGARSSVYLLRKAQRENNQAVSNLKKAIESKRLKEPKKPAPGQLYLKRQSAEGLVNGHQDNRAQSHRGAHRLSR